MSSLAYPKFFCFGLGFSALALSKRLLAAGWHVSGTVRTVQKANLLRELGIEAVVFDGLESSERVTKEIRTSTHILNSIANQGQHDPVFDCFGEELAALSNLEWFGYLSTTVVYGNHDGAWVDENTTCTPSGERGVNRLASEQIWSSMPLPVYIFRLAGIYGPGRNALVTIQKGRAKRINKPGQVFSRIHVDDIATTLLASMANPGSIEATPIVYNVCDDEPCAPAEVIEYGCRLLNVEPPAVTNYEDMDLSPMARTFYEDNKRVKNERIKSELGVHLEYPNYRVALDELIKTVGS
jgi:nucleoside-diphosphate-sugar epimerase